MPKTNPKLAFDTHLLEIYLTGLQSEIEAKVRRVARFREEMRKIDAAGGRTNRTERERAARALIGHIRAMLETNLTVRGTLEELLTAAEAVLADLRAEARAERPRVPRRASGRARFGAVTERSE